MARPPSLRRPALQIMAREMRRIEKKQLDAEDAKQEYALTEADLEAIQAAAKVAALLERVKGEEVDDSDAKGKTPSPDESPEERLRRLEEKTPARVGRGTPDADHDE